MLATHRRPLWPGMIALLIMCGLILSLGLWLFVPDLIRVMVQRLMPPAYPGVALIEQTERLEFGTSTQETTFRVHEKVFNVRTWMDQRMPGFATCIYDASYLPDCFTNNICDTSLVSKGLIWLLLGDAGQRTDACVSVMLIAEQNDADYSIIRYTMSWPAIENESP